MTSWGQTRSFGDVGSMSGLPESGRRSAHCDVAKVPKAAASRCSNIACAEAKILLDHLVGALLQLQSHSEAKCPRGLEIDQELELDRKLDGKLARVFALQNSVHIT